MPSLFCVTHFTFWDLLADFGIAYVLERLYRIHTKRLLCDHQELAYTPKGPPRRVSMRKIISEILMETFIELSQKKRLNTYSCDTDVFC